jgi:hypothetical protein
MPSPGQDQAGQHDQLADHPGLLGADAVDQHAVDQAQQRAGQHGDGDHQALLGGVEVEVLGDGHAQRAQDHPDHEAEVEIQERGEQGRRVAGLQEITRDHDAPRMLRVCESGARAPRAGDRIRAVVSGSHERRCPEA